MLAWLKRNLRIVLLVLGGLSLVPAYLHAYTLIGPSDIPTVLLGDKIIVNCAAYGVNLPYSNVRLFRSGSPKRGDFVLLHILNDPHLKFGFFKRVMGLPGETIANPGEPGCRQRSSCSCDGFESSGLCMGS
jgi:signal peptidase I